MRAYAHIHVEKESEKEREEEEKPREREKSSGVGEISIRVAGPGQKLGLGHELEVGSHRPQRGNVAFLSVLARLPASYVASYFLLLT